MAAQEHCTSRNSNRKTDINTCKNTNCKQKQRPKILKKQANTDPNIYSLSLRPARPPRSSARPPPPPLPQDSGQPPRLTDFATHGGEKKKAKSTNLPHHSRPRQRPPPPRRPEISPFPPLAIGARARSTNPAPGFATVRREPWAGPGSDSRAAPRPWFARGMLYLKQPGGADLGFRRAAVAAAGL